MVDREPRELTPVQMFWKGPGEVNMDFRPFPQKVDSRVPDDGPTAAELAAIEAENSFTPVPKDALAQGSVPFVESAASIAPSMLETPVQQQSTDPTLEQVTSPTEGVDSESGKPNESNEDEPPGTSPTTPDPANLPPSSSSLPKPGGSKPPAPAKPPTSA